MNLNKLIKSKNIEINSSKKRKLFNFYIKKLTNHHIKKCLEYRNILKKLNYKINSIKNYEDYPMLPVTIFKNLNLLSVKKSKIVKTLHSSGTSGQKTSKIHLDKQNSNNQMKALTKIVNDKIGNDRLPMLIIDKNPKDGNDENFNARKVAILGFSLFGKEYCYALDKNGKLDIKILNKFLKKHGNKKFLVFGFTYLIYKNLILNSNKKKLTNNFRNGILIHGGGWKKMKNLSISNSLFKSLLKKKIGLENIYNYYGLIEQTGSIFFECKTCGYLQTSIFSDVIIRDKEFNVLNSNKKGLIQLISLLPTSYPGHNILTEDIGEIVSKKNIKCNHIGKSFIVHGRSEESEVRGCSDVAN